MQSKAFYTRKVELDRVFELTSRKKKTVKHDLDQRKSCLQTQEEVQGREAEGGLSVEQ